MERNCSLLIHYDVKAGGSAVPPTEEELRKELESNDVKHKVKGLKTLILMLLNGYNLPKLLMTVIRYCVTTRDHELKKLLSLYWEVVEKYDSNGKLLPEMILVCNAILNDLKHPNHYIRGCTLRFLCRTKDLEILQPLLPAVLENLSHQEAYVRKNAVMVFHTVYTSFSDIASSLLPDASESIYTALEAENDYTARRNCFLFLLKHDPDLAVKFYQENVTKLMKFGVDFQFVFLDLVRTVCKTSPTEKPRFLKSIFQLLNSTSAATSGDTNLSNAILFEAAWTLISLSSAPTAIRSATEAFVRLLNNSESDNNVRLIVLERLEKLKNNDGCGKIVQEYVLDILRVLNVPDRDIRRKALNIGMSLVGPRNIKEIVAVLKKEVLKTQSKEVDRKEAEVYRQDLIKAIHDCAVRYPSIASSVVHLLMDFLTEGDAELPPKAIPGASSAAQASHSGSLEVIVFIREIMESYPNMRRDIMEKLLTSLPEIGAPDVLRVALWVVGEYSVELGMSSQAMDSVFIAIGTKAFEMKSKSSGTEDESKSEKRAGAQSSGVIILADGSYATQSAPAIGFPSSAPEIPGANDNIIEALISKSDPYLRKLIIRGNYMLASCAISALMKVILKLRERKMDPKAANSNVIRTIKLACSLLSFGRNKDIPANQQMDKDSYERINLYIKVLLDEQVQREIGNIVLTDSRNNLQNFLRDQKKAKRNIDASGHKQKVIQPDEPIMFRQFGASQKLGVQDDMDYDDVQLAVSKTSKNSSASTTASSNVGVVGEEYRKELKNIFQLTGFGDPVYAEANVLVHGFDIIIDVMVINKSKSTLIDLNVELSALGDLKLVDQSQSVNLTSNGVHNFKTNLKVSSTESAQLFGTITYDDPSTKETKYINLNYIVVDIMDYIKPAVCTEEEFRKMWAEFEWENKVAINTKFSTLHKFLQHLVKETNMNCLNITDLRSKAIDCAPGPGDVISEAKDGVDFLAANLYAKSIFAEDALVNVSVEKIGEDKIEGFIRIRAKTQGIALSLGDRINLKQKSTD